MSVPEKAWSWRELGIPLMLLGHGSLPAGVMRFLPLGLCDKIHGVIGQADTVITFEPLCIFLAK